MAEFRCLPAKCRRVEEQPTDLAWGFGASGARGTALAVILGMERPYKPQKTYYLELNGKPSCVSNCHPQASPPWSCAHTTHQEAQEAALLVWRDHPSAAIAIKEGPCPRDVEVWEDQWERSYEYE